MKIVKETEYVDLFSKKCVYNAGPRSFHWHNKFEICRILDNSCHFLIDGKIIEAKKGDIITINAQEVHKFIIDYENTSILVMQFPLKILMNADVSITPLKTHITADEIQYIPGLEKKINNILELLKDEKESPKISGNPFFSSISMSLYFLLMRHFSSTENINIKSDDRRDFYRVVEFVNENFKEDINIKIIASRLYLPHRKLASVFVKYSGIQLNEYINTLRIKNVNTLLSHGYTITEAALESGFQCIRTFNNVYRELMSQTPPEYINKMNSNH